MDYLTSFSAWAHANPYVMTALAVAGTHWQTLLKLVFKVKIVRAFVVGNPTKTKAFLAELVAEVDADIDEAVADAAAHDKSIAPVKI